MAIHKPDGWILFKWEDGEVGVFGSWSGSYLGSASWQRSSPIKSIRFDEIEFTTPKGQIKKKYPVFITGSGSEYHCYAEYTIRNVYNISVFNGFKREQDIIELDEDEVKKFIQLVSVTIKG